MKKYFLAKNQKKINIDIDYKKLLNDEQYQVVTQADGHCLVLAGAGSGKTRTLLYRVSYLLKQGVDPRNILLMTFTNKAAKQMKDGIEEILKYKPKGLWAGTFHHISNRILRKYYNKIGFYKDFGILDEDDARQMLKTCCVLSKYYTKSKLLPKVRLIKNIISFSINSQQSIDNVVGSKYNYLSLTDVEYIQDVAKIYKQRKKESNMFDFDDLLFYLYELLQIKEIKESLAARFYYILVDEYQDTNTIQGLIVKELSSIHNNILVVGDDAQSIYSFRAATVSNILNFEKEYDSVKVFKIQTNYRSSPEILDLANQVIVNNIEQYKKVLKSIQYNSEKPALVPVKDNYQQADFICQRVIELQSEGIELNKMAVLFRSSYNLAELEMELNKRAIPYVVRGGVRFFEQAHIKDVLAFLRLFNNVKDEISLKRILMMCDGIGQTTAHKIYEMVKYCGDIKDLLLILKNYKSREKVRNSLSKIIGILDKIILLRQNIIQESITTVLQNGYETYLRANFDNYQDRLRDLEQLGVFSSQYNSVDDFLSDASLTESFKGEKNLDNTHREDELTVSSIHQAKGLEWDVVFVISLINGYFPHYKVYDNPLEFSEERRLFYVACTRAKKNLYCIYPIISRGVLSDCKINRPSDFITEVNEKVFEKWHIYGTEKLMNSLSNDKNRTVENKNFSKNHYKYNKVDNKENLYKENNEAAVYDIEDVKNTKSILGKVAKMNQKNYKHLGNSWDEDGFFQEETIEYD